MKYNIIIGLATMSTRKNSLQKTIESLNNQTIKADKIIIYQNDENNFDATDNGKFYYFEGEVDENTIFFSSDDDIIYPPTYIEDMINQLKRYNNKAIVTHHGRKLLGTNRNYFNMHKSFIFKAHNNFQGDIDVPGTGCTAFHTSYFKPNNIFNNTHKRMSDLLFALEAAKQNKRIVVLAHKQGYLQDICDDHINSCFVSESKSPTIQNKIADEIYNIKYTTNIYVLIAAYKAQDYIKECLDSIKYQQFKGKVTVHMILGIDNCEATDEIVNQIKDNYENLKVIYFTENKGKWITINSLLDEVPNNAYVQIFDADDKMQPTMLEQMLKYTPCFSKYSGISLIHKSLYEKLGGYKDWRIAADTEFRSRFIKIYPQYRGLQQLFFRRVHNDSLTQSKTTGYGSELRNKYVNFIEDNKNNKEVFIEKVINDKKRK
jgi:GT2 family glycosyltransferase